MIWLSLVTSLALAQDADPLGLGTPPDAADPIAAEATEVVEGVTVPATTAPVAEAPVRTPAARSASTTTVTAPVDSGWLFSFGGPAALLVLAGGVLWYVRKNGLKVGGMSLGGLQAFNQAQTGPQVRVAARSALGGQDSVAVIEVTGFGAPRHLLVTTGPGGSRLVADLSAAPGQEGNLDGALHDALQKAMGGSWTAPQAHVAPVAPPQPVPVYAGAPAAAAPMMAAAPAPAPAPRPAPAPEVDAGYAQPAFSAAPPPTSRRSDEGGAAAAGPASPRISPPSAQAWAEVEEDEEEVPRRGRASQGEQAFENALKDEMRARRAQVPPTERPRKEASRSALQGRARDWRSATYLQESDDDPPREEDLVDVIGEFAHLHKGGTQGSARGGSRGAVRGTARTTAAAREPVRKRRQGASRGHLEQLVRNHDDGTGRRFGGSASVSETRRPTPVLREAGSRRERTEAARALLEKVMAQRRGDAR